MSDPNIPPPDAERQPDGAYMKYEADGTRLRWTRRPDGTWRKPERVRAGFTPQLEQQKYVAPAVAKHVPDPDYDRGARIPGLVPGMAPEAQANVSPNEKKKQKRQEAKIEKEREAILAAANNTSTGGYAARNNDEGLVQAMEGLSVDPEKKKRNLMKTLTQIEALEEKRKNGVALSEPELAKIARRPNIENEIIALNFSVEVSHTAVAQPEIEVPKPHVVDARPIPTDTVDVENAQPVPRQTDIVDVEKRRKQLQKKLRQIEELEAKAAKGSVLDADMLAKIATRTSLEEELAKL